MLPLFDWFRWTGIASYDDKYKLLQVDGYELAGTDTFSWKFAICYLLLLFDGFLHNDLG
jgi:hypothetical protein